jgi:hypothetical protein
VPISDRDRKILWSKAGNRCSKCRRALVQPGEADGSTDHAIVGEECHVISPKQAGPRGRLPTAGDLDGYGNLILLCPSDHTLIDQLPDEWPPDRLHALKAAHEKWVDDRLSSSNENGHRNDAVKIAAYSAFLEAIEARVEHLIGDMNLAQVGIWRDDDGDVLPDPTVPLQTIAFLAPAVASAAEAMWNWYLLLSLRTMRERVTGERATGWADSDAVEYNRHRDAVVAAMQTDLA